MTRARVATRMPNGRAVAAVWAAMAWLAGCATLNRATKYNYDRRGITIETFSLFNQRMVGEDIGPRWQGDWYLRRLRLGLVDQNLRSEKPDLVIFQEGMARQSHPADNDQDILAMGALRGYQWDAQEVKTYEDTDEMESMLVAVAPPLGIDESMHLSSESRAIDLGENGQASWTRISLNRRPLLIFNVNLAEDVTMHPEVYDRLYQSIVAIANEEPKICLDRIVIAGRFSGTLFDLEFIHRLQFKDVSTGFCDVASSCQTASPTNELFALGNPGYLPLQVDRIFVHESALVGISRRTEEASVPAPDVVATYGLTKIFAGKRYGWLANVRFNGCD